MARKSVTSNPYLPAADRYLRECFAAGTPPHVNEFALAVGVSPRSLGRAFRAETGASVASYFKNARTARACDLLISTDSPLDAIADAAGFGTRATFFRAFKRATGRTPNDFRAEHRQFRKKSRS